MLIDRARKGFPMPTITHATRFFFSYHIQTDSVYPSDERGRILSQEEWEALRSDVDKFYSTQTVGQIVDWNEVRAAKRAGQGGE